jgi:hypothetical protein
MTEAELRALIVDAGHALGWEVFSLPAVKTRRPVKDAVGYPDLTLARRHTVLFMELKTDNGVVSEDQWRWGIALPDWYVIRPADWNDGRVAGLLA